MNTNTSDLKTTANIILALTKRFIENIEKNKLHNEQFFLDWEDELNKLSTKNHDTSL